MDIIASAAAITMHVLTVPPLERSDSIYSCTAQSVPFWSKKVFLDA